MLLQHVGDALHGFVQDTSFARLLGSERLRSYISPHLVAIARSRRYYAIMQSCGANETGKHEQQTQPKREKSSRLTALAIQASGDMSVYLLVCAVHAAVGFALVVMLMRLGRGHLPNSRVVHIHDVGRFNREHGGPEAAPRTAGASQAPEYHGRWWDQPRRPRKRKGAKRRRRKLESARVRDSVGV